MQARHTATRRKQPPQGGTALGPDRQPAGSLAVSQTAGGGVEVGRADPHPAPGFNNGCRSGDCIKRPSEQKMGAHHN